MVASYRSAHRPYSPNSAPDGGGADVGVSPRLRLVVDNSASVGVPVSAFDVGIRRPVPGGGLAPNRSDAVISWLRLRRQFVVNKFRAAGLVADVTRMAPVVLICAVVVFGGLLGLRLVQGEAGPAAVAGQAVVVNGGSVAPAAAVSAVAESTGDRAVIVVGPGESLWSIASERFPGHDTRAAIDLLVAANGTSTIEVGQQLVVPVELVAGG